MVQTKHSKIVGDSDSTRKYCQAMSDMMWGQTWNTHARALNKSATNSNILENQETGIMSMHERKIRIPTALLQEIECPGESSLEQVSYQDVRKGAKYLTKNTNKAKSTLTSRLETAIDICISAPHGSYATSDEFSLIVSDCVKAFPPGLTGFASPNLEVHETDKQDEIRSYLENVLSNTLNSIQYEGVANTAFRGHVSPPALSQQRFGSYI